LNGPANGFFISIRSGGVDQTVAGLDGLQHAPLTFNRIGDLKYAEPEQGHFYAVVQSDEWYI